MKVLVATQGNRGLEDFVSPVFGRTPYFTVVEIKENNVEVVEITQNPAQQAFKGAGMMATQFAIERGVNIVIAGRFGPNARMALETAGIQAVEVSPGTKVSEIINQLLEK